MGGLASRRDEVREEKRKDIKGTRARGSWRDATNNEREKREREREKEKERERGEKSNKRYKEGVKKRVGKNK